MKLEEFLIDLDANRIESNGRVSRLTPKASGVLAQLIRHQQQVVRRDDLLGRVWHDGFPTDDVLTHAIRELRRSLNDDTRAPRIIETIPRVGYRLAVPVVLQAETECGSTASGAVEPDVSSQATVFSTASLSVEATRNQTGSDIWRRASGKLLVACAGFGLLLAWAMSDDRNRVLPSGLDRALLARPAALTSDPGSEYFPALSPDGSWVVFVGQREGSSNFGLLLQSRQPDAVPRVLVPPRDDRFIAHPVWSPDGMRVFFAESGPGHCLLRSVAIGNGATRDIARCRAGLVDALDVMPDAANLITSADLEAEGASPSEPGRILVRINADTGTSTPLAYSPRRRDDVDIYPRLSPDGAWVAFRRGLRPYADVWIVPSSGGTARRLAAFGANLYGLAWTPDGRHLVVSSDHEGTQALYRIAVANGVAEPLGPQHANFVSIARHAEVLAYDQDRDLSQLVLFDFRQSNRTSQGRLIAPSSRPDRAPALSPDGKRVAFVSERSGSPQIWLHDFDDESTQMLTRLDRASPGVPQWAPDGSGLLYIKREEGSSALIEVDVLRGRERRLGQASERIRFGSFSSDSRWIHYSSDRDGTWKVWRMRSTGEDAQPLGGEGAMDPRQFPEDAGIYFTRLTVPGLFRLDPASGQEQLVSERIAYLGRSPYHIASGRLLIAQREKDKFMTMWSRPLLGGIESDSKLSLHRELYFDNGDAWPVATFDRSGSRIVANVVTSGGSDVMVMNLTHQGDAD